MKLNIAYPANGTQKIFDIEDVRILAHLYEKRISQEIDGGLLGDQFKGYIIKITGGQDKQGFFMKQGVLTNTRVKLLLPRGTIGAQGWRGRGGKANGERKRKSVRGCIVGPDITSLNMIIVKKGEEELPGITDKEVPLRLGPKRATKLRRLFNVPSDADVCKFVIRRQIPAKEGGKPHSKAAKIQRLITPVKLQRWRKKRAHNKAKREASKQKAIEYAKSMQQRARNSFLRKKSRTQRQIKSVKA